MYFVRNIDTFRLVHEKSLDIHDKLPVGNYTIMESMTGEIFLELVDDFPTLSKIYGSVNRNADRILSTFLDRALSTGVILSGEKGSGKTLLAKTLSQKAADAGIPTIIVNHPIGGDNFSKFLQSIEQPCMLLFDEFEKVYDLDQQESILTLLDGVFPSKKLFVITCNDKWRINNHMRNRPGRIFYMLEFAGLESEFIREYCQDNLNNKDHVDKVCEIVALFHQFNFDMLKALVEEMNRYNETPQESLQMLNAKPEYNSEETFEVSLVVDGKQLTDKELENTGNKVWRGRPLIDILQINWIKIDPPKAKGKKKAPIDDDDYYDDDEKLMTCIFRPSHIKKIDVHGRFTYVNDEAEVLVLTRKKVPSFNYLGYGQTGSTGSGDDPDYNDDEDY